MEDVLVIAAGKVALLKILNESKQCCTWLNQIQKRDTKNISEYLKDEA